MVVVVGLLLTGAATVAEPVSQAGSEFPTLLISQAGKVDPDGGLRPLFEDRTEVSAPDGPGDLEGPTTSLREDIFEMARRIATGFGVDPLLVEAVIWIESSVKPGAVSAGGARGLMQLRPRTAERFGVEDALDPTQNVEGGVRYLRWLLDRYCRSVPLALAAYNAGETAVDRHAGIPPYTVTRTFLHQVLTRYREAGAKWAPPLRFPVTAGSRSRTADEECRPIDRP